MLLVDNVIPALSLDKWPINKSSHTTKYVSVPVCMHRINIP